MYTARHAPRAAVSPSGWCALLPPRRPQPPLQGHATADVVIVGAGFAGLAAARRLMLADRRLRVCVLEAQQVADGAAGRNSGFMIDLPHEVSADDHAGDHTGDSTGNQANTDRPDIHANRTAIAQARALAEEEGWGPEVFDPCGKFNVAMGAQGDHHVQTYAQQLRALGEPCTVLDARETAEVTGTAAFSSAIYTPGTVMVQPADYIRRLADRLAREVTLHEQSPVQAIERVGSAWQVRTEGGTVQARHVILATNGQAQGFGLYPRQLLHVFTYASLSAPFEPGRLGGRRHWAATPAAPMGTTVRRVQGIGSNAGDRILVRSRYTHHADLQVSAADIASAGRVHDRKFRERFPMLADVPMVQRWAGAMAVTWNGVSGFGEVEPGLWSTGACNGVGATKASAAGIAAAEAVLGLDSRLLRTLRGQAAPRRLPPQPFLSVGAGLHLRLREWRAGRE